MTEEEPELVLGESEHLGLGQADAPEVAPPKPSRPVPPTPSAAKEKESNNLVLNPTKVAGQCGRLKCCLVYEQDLYHEMRKTLPKVGKRVSAPGGNGRVLELDAAISGMARVDGALVLTCRTSIDMVQKAAAAGDRKSTRLNSSHRL